MLMDEVFVFELHSCCAYDNQPLAFTCSNFTCNVAHLYFVFIFCFASTSHKLVCSIHLLFSIYLWGCCHLKFYNPQWCCITCSFVFTSSFAFTFNIVCIWCIFAGRMPDVSSGRHTAHIPDSTYIPEHLFYYWASHNTDLHPDTETAWCVKYEAEEPIKFSQKIVHEKGFEMWNTSTLCNEGNDVSVI